MTTRTWIHHLFGRTPRTIRKAPARYRPGIEALEDRTTPARVVADVAKLPGDFDKPHTGTEIMAAVHSPDAAALLHEIVASNRRTAALIDPAASRVILNHEGTALVQVAVAPGADATAAAAWLATYSEVAWVAPNAVHVGDARDFTPNDTSYTSQYHLQLMSLPTAWDTTTGTSNIIVAVCDNGVAFNHPDLAGSIWNNADEVAGNSIDDDGNGFVDDVRGWDFSAGDNNPNPGGPDNHGTHVSGIVAARTNNGVGVAGVAGGDGMAASGVRIMPIRWDGETAWTAARVAESFTYAADNGAKIVNSSYAFDGFATDATVRMAFEYTYARGVLHFNSAGNGGSLSPPRNVLTYPLFVANTNATDVKAGGSDYGPYVDISAPGTSILATTTNTSGTVFTYGNLSGTSMAAPNAAGVAALIWSQNPLWTREQVVARLLGTADSVDGANPNFLGFLGTGRPDATAALATATALTAPRLGAITGLPAAGGITAAAVKNFSVVANDRFDPTSVVAANFELRGDGADNAFDTPDDVLVPLTVNAAGPYRVGTNSLTFAAGESAPDRYRFVAKAAGLRNPFGTFLDGDGDGTAGGDFVREFMVARQLTGTAYEDWNGNGTLNATDPGLAGVTVYVDGDNDSVLDQATQTFTSTTVVPILDLTAVSSTVAVAGLPGTIDDINVTLNITHTYAADLDVFLVAPDNSRVELFTDVGGSGHDFTATTLDDQAATDIVVGAAPFTASFRPEGALSVFNGRSANGTWRLEIFDDAGQDIGSLTAWSLRIVSGEMTGVTTAAGEFAINGLAVGNHVVRRVAPTGYVASGPASVSVSLPAATSTAVANLGLVRGAPAVYGQVFSDTDLDGVFDDTEVGQPGRVVYLDVNANDRLDRNPVTYPSPNVPVAITDLATVSSSRAVSGVSGTLNDIDVSLTLTHTYDEDLDVVLIAPNGTRVELFTDVGGLADNFTGTTLDDQAATSIVTGFAPFTGSFRPEGSLTSLVGLSPNGTWILEITDDAGLDFGELTAWSLTLSTGEIAVVTDALGNYRIPSGVVNVPVRLDYLAGQGATSPPDNRRVVTATIGPAFGISYGQRPDAAAPTAVVAAPPSSSRVTELVVTFNEVVAFANGDAAGAFALTRAGGGPVALTATASLVGNATVVVLRFADTTEFGSLVDGRYTLTGDATRVRDIALNQVQPVAPLAFHRLFGDVNGDATVNAFDFGQMRNANGSSFGQPAYRDFLDFNDDDTINAFDFGRVRDRFGITLP